MTPLRVPGKGRAVHSGTVKSGGPIRSVALGAVVLAFAVLSVTRNAAWKDAITIWADAVEKSPFKVRTYNNLGTAYQGAKRYDDALAVYRRAMALDPTVSLHAYGNIGNVYLDKEEYERAADLFTRILAIDANDYQSNVGRGKANYARGRYAESLADFDRAISLAPSVSRYYFYRAEVLLKMGEVARARKDLARSCSLRWEEACMRLREMDKE